MADLVLEGGGVKGIGLVGAVKVLHEAGYEFPRIAGTSAGAIVASFLAAGMSSDDLINEMHDLNYAKLEDGGGITRLGTFGRGVAALLSHGAFRGDYLHRWVSKRLADYNVTTWADLRRPDVDSDTPIEQRYRLVVIVSDISRGRMLRLPWDYADLCGLDADTQPVADAVRASASIPFFFRPMTLACGGGHKEHQVTLVDGGLLSNFPVDIFDDHNPWPTLGVKLSARPDAHQTRWRPMKSGLEMAMALIGTMVSAHDQRFIDEPSIQQRTIFVDTMKVKSTNFGIDALTREDLLRKGIDAATKFLAEPAADGSAALAVTVPEQRAVVPT
jgi:NTE family protein